MSTIPDRNISLQYCLEWLRGRKIVYQGKEMIVRNFLKQASLTDVYKDEIQIVCDAMTIRLHEDYAYEVIKSIVDHNIPSKPKSIYKISDETRESNRNLDR